jgi:hypothetical protein
MNTSDHQKYRDERYRSEPDRWKLRNKIVSDLFNKERIENEDHIKLGKGGALPRTPIKKEKTVTIITGLPASGKSTISNKIADEYGSIILDSDYAKRKMPEFKDFFTGATILHEESDSIVFGFPKSHDFKSLLELGIQDGANFVIPKIGHNVKSIVELATLFKEKFKYKVNLILVSLDRKDATLRALKRFIKTKRYVPLSLIFDGYSNEPILSYYRIKNQYTTIFDSIGKVSTSGIPADYQIIENTNNGPLKVFVK